MNKYHLIRKWLAVSTILLLFGTSIFPATAQDTEKPLRTSRGNWLYVGGSGPGNYTKIQDAINNASNGDTVFVYNGTYYENIVINLTIDLIGQNRTTTFIDGGGIGNAVIVFTDNVSISGFTIQNSFGYSDVASGIRIFSSHNTISGNTLTNNPGWADGIRLSGNNNTIIRNTITNNGHCAINSWGVFNNNTISDNIISDNSYSGIMLCSNDGETISGNIIVNNTLIHNGGYFGIFIIDGINSIISHNTFIYNQGGINLDGDSNMISGNIMINNQAVGITFTGYNNTISENTISKTSGGIDLGYGGNHNYITNNTIRNVSYSGIGLYDVNNNIILGNTIINNTGDGIILTYASNNFISGNTLINNHYGITFSVYNIHDNIIYHNNFINNMQNAYDANDKNNTWYNTFLHEGNYWSDYNGTDANGDGIGDSPYTISGGSNQDLYPLMHPFEYVRLEIIKITGGLGVNAIIKNNGTSDITNVPWQIHVAGGILGLINKTINGTASIKAKESQTISTGMLLGVGSLKISAQVGVIEKTVKGTQILIFTIVAKK